MSNLSVNEAANAATCGHVFHEPCLVQWFLRSKTCPQCRTCCDERQVFRLYFSASLNNSTVDIDTLQVQNAIAEITLHKNELARLRAVEKKLKEKMDQVNNLEYIKSILDSDGIVSEIELLKDTDAKQLAALVSACRPELRKITRSRDEVKNHCRVCMEENTKLKKKIKDLSEKSSTWRAIITN